MKTILVTGAGGVLGSSFINALLPSEYKIYALDLKKEFMSARIKPQGHISFFDTEDLKNGTVPLSNVDLILHCAFARTQQGADLTASIDFTESIFKLAAQHKVKGVINISSQSIYGNYRENPSVETDVANPLDMYAVSKYACEKISRYFSNRDTKISNVRLASLIGPQFSERLVNKMLKFAVENKRMNVVGGEQIFSFLDIRDAVSGLMAMCAVEPDLWKEVYNLGNNENYSILVLAQTIQQVVQTRKSFKVDIDFAPQDIKMKIKLNNDLFFKDFNWKAKNKLADTITYIYDSLYNEN